MEFTIAILCDELQAPAGTVAIMRDVTQQFEELRALRRRLAALEAAALGGTAPGQRKS